MTNLLQERLQMEKKTNTLPEKKERRINKDKSIESDADVIDALNCTKDAKTITFIDKKYKMNHPRRGKAIIFSHYRFKNQYPERKGTGPDVKNLTKALLELGFKSEDIHIYEDLGAANVAHVLQEVQHEDHTERDLLMVFALTHGNQNEKISAYDVEYPVESLWEPFRADKCCTLAGKPKIFFVIACRGDTIDQGHRLSIDLIKGTDYIENESVTEVDATPIEFCYSYSIPVWSDFLYVFSTYKGYISFRNIDAGTWYIQAFCEELSKINVSQISFLDFLTAVNGRLSRLFETGNFWDTRKQIPTFSSTLTKSLYFTLNKYKSK